MGIKRVTVPDANQSTQVDLTGLSVIVVSAPSYFKPEEAPKLSFNNAGGGIPILSRSIFPSDQGEFNQLVVTGTSESAGDEVVLLSYNTCLQAYINPDLFVTGKAIAGNTFTKASTDAAQGLSELELVDAEGNLPSSIYVSASTADIRYAFNDGSGTDPDQSGFGSLLSVDDNPQEIQGIDFIINFKFASDTAATPGDLIIHLEY